MVGSGRAGGSGWDVGGAGGGRANGCGGVSSCGFAGGVRSDDVAVGGGWCCCWGEDFIVTVLTMNDRAS